MSLFSKPPQKESGPSAFVVSIVIHSIIFGLLFLTVRRVRVIENNAMNRKYQVRLLNVQKTEARLKWFPQKNIAHPGEQAGRRALSPGGRLGHLSTSHVARVSRNFKTAKPSPNTMIQPEVPPDTQVMQQIPIPQAVVWTPGEIVHKRIVPPVPQDPGSIEVIPSLAMPNHELNPADLSLSSTQFVTKAPIPAPGTTSPVNVSGPQPAKQLPETASKDTEQISPARVISMSDLKLDDGTAALPVVNEVAQSDASGSPTPGQAEGHSQSGNDVTDSRQIGTGMGHGAGSGGDIAGGTVIEDGSNAGPGDGVTIDTGKGLPSGDSPTTEHIVLPKNGQYGMVVVGASPEEDYPETEGLWAGRMVYSVYLQTDTAENWILQYALPRAAQNSQINVDRPDPPWPYDMMRPSLGSYNDVVLVHGFVSAAGRFEQLSVAYPPGFIGTSLLLRALRDWEFRPAISEGQPATVEVLLIIPGTE
jgi:hypothetical protein